MTELYTVDHPYVLAYIEYATAAMREAEANSHEHGLAGCVDPRWHQLADHKQQTSWWRVEYGGVARPESVADALRPLRAGRPPFSIYEAERVLAVAALKVIDRPTHPAHWAFWARNARERVAHVVQEVVREKPKRIEVPLNAGWVDPDYNLYTLRMYQHGWLPLIRRPNGEHLRAAPPKRPAAVKTRTSARNGRKATAKARAPAQSETNANGKRVAPADEEEPVDVEAPAAKRQKRAPTAAAPSAKGQPKPRGKKAAKASATSDTSASPPPARETRARTRASAAAKQAQSAPAPTPTIRIVPPSKAHALAAAKATNAEAAALLPEASESASFSAFRDSGASLDASLTLSPLSSPPSTPSKSTPSSTSTSPTPKRPVGQCMPQRALSVAQSDCSELSLAPSASVTLVESTAPSDTCSTRAGTPTEVDLVGEKAKGKGKAGAAKSRTSTPRTPARTSARIQAKKCGSSPESSDSPSSANRSWNKRRV